MATGYFKETGTKATWANPQITPESARQNGGWYYNPASGSVDRWWNGAPDTTNPSGGSSGVLSGSNPSGPAPTIDVGSAYKTADSMIAQPDTSSLETAAANLQAEGKATNQAYQAAVPSVQNLYSDLAKTLSSQFQTQTQQIQKQGTEKVAGEKAAAAAGGFDSRSGFESSIIRSTQQDTNLSIQSAADKYSVSADSLMQEESKDVSTLLAEGQKAELEGDSASADLSYKIADLKQQRTSLVQTAAKNIIDAQSAEESQYWKNYYDAANLKISQQLADIEAKKVSISKYTPVTTYNSQGQPVISAFDIQTGQTVGGSQVGTASKAASAQYPQPAPGDQNAIAAWATDVRNGTATIAQVPASIKNAVASAVSQQ